MRWDFWRRKRHNTDLEDEIAHDLALEAEDRIRSGATPREAELAKSTADVPSTFGFRVSTDYFHTMRTHLLSGRDFDSSDKEGGRRVAILSSSFASELLDGANPLGQRFSLNPSDKPFEIVGVC